MNLHELKSIKNIKAKKRLGRGLSSGKGQTSGRGTKGQKSRSGYNIPRRFEGGQTPLIQRLPKKIGFNSHATKPTVVHVVDIEKKFKDGDIVNFKTLIEKKLIKDSDSGVKILGPGHITKKLKFFDVKLTKKLLEDSKKISINPKEKVSKVTKKPA